MINITDVWNFNHSHLKPFRNHLPFQTGYLHSCPSCSGADAFYVVADIVISGGQHKEKTNVLFCPNCEDYFVDIDSFFVKPQASMLEVESVNARLWVLSPEIFNLEPTTRCNFNCWYCFGRHMKQEDLRLEDFNRILTNTEEVGAIALVGEGEPLLHPDFFEMARIAKKHNRKIVTISNGSLFTAENVLALCESGIVYVAVSIDSTEEENFSSSRINGKLKDVLDGIRRLRTFRDANGYKYPKIAVKGTLFKYNEHELNDIVMLAREYGAEIFESFQSLNLKHSYVDIYPDEQREELSCAKKVSATIAKDSLEANQLLLPVREFFDSEGIGSIADECSNLRNRRCNETMLHALLSGEITPCCQVKDPLCAELNLVNQPLGELLQHPIYENLRFNLLNGVFPDYCAGCAKVE